MATRRDPVLVAAIQGHYIVTLIYRKPVEVKKTTQYRMLTYHVRPYEIKPNRYGRWCLWATDSRHGPKQIHSFRLDRIIKAIKPQHVSKFKPSIVITRHMRERVEDE